MRWQAIPCALEQGVLVPVLGVFYSTALNIHNPAQEWLEYLLLTWIQHVGAQSILKLCRVVCLYDSANTVEQCFSVITLGTHSPVQVQAFSTST